MLANASPQHSGRYIPIATFLLRFVQDVQHHPLLASQAVPDIRYLLVSHRHIISQNEMPVRAAARQVGAIVVVIPFAALLAYWVPAGGHPNFATDKQRLFGYAVLVFNRWVVDWAPARHPCASA